MPVDPDPELGIEARLDSLLPYLPPFVSPPFMSIFLGVSGVVDLDET